MVLENFSQFTKKFKNCDFCQLDFRILSNGVDRLSVRHVASERRNQFMIKLTVFKKKCQYYNVTILCQVKSWKYCFKT